MVRIRSAEPLEGFNVRLEFTDGTQKVVDLEPYLHGPVFEALRNDAHVYQSLTVDAELGTIVWPNGADIDPDTLYLDLRPSWREEGRPKDIGA